MKLFWRSQWRKLHRYEGETCRRFSGVVAVSDVDKQVMEREFQVKNVWAIPTGVDLEFFTPRQGQVRPHSLIFTGSMDWLPNEDALLYFAEQILGRVKASIPDVTVSIVGRKPSPRLLERLKAYPEMKIVGRVDDIRPHVAHHAAYIIPLRIGGGTRIKFYEAMAMGKAVVSTSIGAEGLPVIHGEHVLLADTAEDFAAAVVRVLSDHTLRAGLERAGRRFVEERCSWKVAASIFAEICRRVASLPTPRS
jgi:glycosyltransferase involved in cell wall biosynthesis